MGHHERVHHAFEVLEGDFGSLELELFDHRVPDGLVDVGLSEVVLEVFQRDLAFLGLVDHLEDLFDVGFGQNEIIVRGRHHKL